MTRNVGGSQGGTPGPGRPDKERPTKGPQNKPGNGGPGRPQPDK